MAVGTGVGAWSTTAGSNETVGSINWQEGVQAPSTVNNSTRQMMADTRFSLNEIAGGWFQLGDGDGQATYTYVSGTSFRVDGADVTSAFHVGRRVKLTAPTPGTIYGTITISSFSTNTTLTLTWDSGSLSSEAITAVYIGIIPATNTPVPASSVAAASETVSGIAELATQAEADAGTDNTRIMTALKIKTLAASFFTGAQTAIAADTTRGTVEFAVQSEMETGTSNVLVVTPGRQHFHPGSAKYWIAFDGTGTPAAAASYNHASITDNGAGDYTLNIATDFSSAAFAAFALANASGGAATTCILSTKAAGSVRILVTLPGTGLVDVTDVNVLCFGDHA